MCEQVYSLMSFGKGIIHPSQEAGRQGEEHFTPDAPSRLPVWSPFPVSSHNSDTYHCTLILPVLGFLKTNSYSMNV